MFVIGYLKIISCSWEANNCDFLPYELILQG